MLARIESNFVVEYRNIVIDDVPPQKQALWLPVVDTDPPYDARVQTKTGPVVTVNPGVDVQRVWTVTDRDLATVKTELQALVDKSAEARRLVYITDGTGMMLTYDEKRRQADAVIALGQVAADALTLQDAESQYPVLAASIAIEAATLWDCAQLVATKYAQWGAIANVIEKTRLGGKAAIEAATTVTEAAAAYDTVTWAV